jgi:hypothetical protein
LRNLGVHCGLKIFPHAEAERIRMLVETQTWAKEITSIVDFTMGCGA